MSRRTLLGGLIALVLTSCRLDAKEHHGQQWQHEIVGARGYFAGNPTQAFAITDEHGDPIWGGACLCAGTHLIYQQFRNGDIPANEVTELVRRASTWVRRMSASATRRWPAWCPTTATKR